MLSSAFVPAGPNIRCRNRRELRCVRRNVPLVFRPQQFLLSMKQDSPPETLREAIPSSQTTQPVNPAECSSSIRTNPTDSSSSLPTWPLFSSSVIALSLLSAAPATALSAGTIMYAPLFQPLQQASPEWLRTLVWVDFRVAVALFVFTPLTFFFWSFADRESKTDACKRVLIGYWQASSLLMLTVFLNIGNQPIAAGTGLFVQALIPVTLTWWQDLNAEIDADNSALAKAYKAWRWPAVLAAVAGVIAQLPNQSCLFAGDPSQNPMCSAWLEPPHALHNLLLSGIDPSIFVTLAYCGLAVYFPYLAWLTFVVVPRVGRLGRKDRNCFSSVSALKVLGWIDKESPGN